MIFIFGFGPWVGGVMGWLYFYLNKLLRFQIGLILCMVFYFLYFVFGFLGWAVYVYLKFNCGPDTWNGSKMNWEKHLQCIQLTGPKFDSSLT